MGQMAARRLLRQLEGQDQPATAEQVRGQLIVRESCGAMEVKPGEKEFWTRTTPRRLLYEASRAGEPAPSQARGEAI